MSKLTMIFVALCVLHTIFAYQMGSPDPLVAAKMQVQNDIRSINMQISINNRNIGFEIQPIRTRNSMTLKGLIIEMKASAIQCAATNIADADSIWRLIDRLDICRMNEKLEYVRATAMPTLNQLLGEADRNISACKTTADYAGCAQNAAGKITESSAEITAEALKTVASIGGEAAGCLAEATAELEGRIDTLSNNWNACKAN